MLEQRIEELEDEVQSPKQLIYEIEYATTRLIDEKIEGATSGLVSLEEVEVAFDL